MIILNPSETNCPRCHAGGLAVEDDSYGPFYSYQVLADLKRRRRPGNGRRGRLWAIPAPGLTPKPPQSTSIPKPVRKVPGTKQTESSAMMPHFLVGSIPTCNLGSVRRLPSRMVAGFANLARSSARTYRTVGTCQVTEPQTVTGSSLSGTGSSAPASPSLSVSVQSRPPE